MGCACKESSEKNSVIKDSIKGNFFGSTFGMILLSILLSPILIPGTLYYLIRFLATGSGFDNKVMNNYLIKKLNKVEDVEID